MKVRRIARKARKGTLAGSKIAVGAGKIASAAGFSQGRQLTQAGRVGRAAARGDGMRAANNVAVLRR